MEKANVQASKFTIAHNPQPITNIAESDGGRATSVDEPQF